MLRHESRTNNLHVCSFPNGIYISEKFYFDFWSSLKNHIYVIAEREISATTTILTKLLVPISTGRKDNEAIPLQM
jgi:hypothetical protein